jgi:cytochrome P450/NADPH-cytochrome P450 reductase
LLADPQVALTIKPGGFKIKVRRRPGRDFSNLGGASSTTIPAQQTKGTTMEASQPQNTKPFTILYGSNSGTCKTYSEELASNAARFGFEATVQTLDSATEHVPKDQPVIIIAPSYEGKPADNAKKFVTWLESNASSKILENVQYGVFSVGNSDWVTTFHRVPKLIDELFEKMGAKRFTNTGFVDVKADILGPFDEWSAVMWEDIRKASSVTTEVVGVELQTEITPPKFVTHLGGPDMSYGIVKVNKSLGGSEVGLEKKHIEIELPLGSGYRSGAAPLNLQRSTHQLKFE